MYYLQSRYYDPEVGRFINGDEIETFDEIETISGVNLYAYCENDPVNYNDVSGKRRYYATPTIKVKYYAVILTIPQFYVESSLIASDLRTKSFSTKLYTLKKNSDDDLIYEWNRIPNTVSLVIINCHGSNSNVNGSNYFTIRSLKKKTLRLLILLSCNGGHQDFKTSNVGYYFSKRINFGNVLCSDGAVLALGLTFSSIADKSWKSLRKKPLRSKNGGWFTYHDGTCKKYGARTITIRKAISDLY